MQWALVDKNSVIQNVIAYDGSSQYTPADGLSLQQVNSWLGIGNNVNDPQPVPPPLSPSDVAQVAIAGGITITSTGTPSLNGTYATNAKAQNDINAIITFILVNGTFPGGISQIPWADASGAMHVFPSVASFQEFATAFANFVVAATMYGNGIGTLPSNQITIP